MELAQIIDQTNIDNKALEAHIRETARGAKRYNFRGLCVRKQWVKVAKEELEGSKVKVICLVDPPIGDSSRKERLEICHKAKQDGADELDVVMSLPDIKHERWDQIIFDLKEICSILPTKVIIGSGYLTEDEIVKSSGIVKKVGAICVKTATEKDPLEPRELEEKLRHLKLMKKSAPGLLIKASGNIKTFQDVQRAVSIGVDIIGTSSGVEILKESQ